MNQIGRHHEHTHTRHTTQIFVSKTVTQTSIVLCIPFFSIGLLAANLKIEKRICFLLCTHNYTQLHTKYTQNMPHLRTKRLMPFRNSRQTTTTTITICKKWCLTAIGAIDILIENFNYFLLYIKCLKIREENKTTTTKQKKKKTNEY